MLKSAWKFIFSSLVLSALSGSAFGADVTIAAAASLKDALEEIKPELEKSIPGLNVLITTGSSGTLRAQISQGAPIDIYLSAAQKPMEELARKKKLLLGSRHILLSNELVLIAPSANPFRITSLGDLDREVVKRIAIGEARSVPAGQYAEEALEKKGLLKRLSPKFLLAKDVRQVLAYVDRGEVAAGFVYRSDLQAKSKPNVKVVESLSKELHSPIVYELAVILQNSRSRAQESLVHKVSEYLKGKAAAQIWINYGFQIPGEKSASVRSGSPRVAP